MDDIRTCTSAAFPGGDQWGIGVRSGTMDHGHAVDARIDAGINNSLVGMYMILCVKFEMSSKNW